MATLGRLVSPGFRTYRSLSTSYLLNSKANVTDDPVKKLFLDKLAEFKSKKNVSNLGLGNILNFFKYTQVPMSPVIQKEFTDETARLKRIYGADKEDLSQFPHFTFKD